MARAKNRGYQQSFSPSYTIRRWRLGIYIRLSKEDLKKGKDDSNSVKNQRDLLNDFYRRNIEASSVCEAGRLDIYRDSRHEAGLPRPSAVGTAAFVDGGADGLYARHGVLGEHRQPKPKLRGRRSL